MNSVIAVLREYSGDQNVRFVFPSQTSASLWARKICTLGIVRSVAANRFLAWDRFKEEAIQQRETERTPASVFTRKLFAEALVRRNAESVRNAGFLNPGGGTPGLPLKSLIPPEHAQGGGVFVPFIARFLPSLAYWEKTEKNSRSKTGSRPADDEDKDYETIKKEYDVFLERHNLFEPSWEEIKILGDNTRYVLFFPELIEDFAEYDDLLPSPRFIRVRAETSAAEEQTLLYYQSAREEIRGAVMELQKLHEEEGIPYEDMAVSVPELEKLEPWLLREFSLRHIPVTRRAGKKLGETGAGRLFSLVNEYAASRFSFSSLKALLLNDHIPWKEREKNKALINFGIKYNCVSGYAQDGAAVDIWEEAFREAYSDGGRELRPYYRNLKEWALGLAGSKSFAEIKKNYFSYRNGVPYSGLLEMEKISKDDDAVLSRCVVELSSLVDLEEKLNDPALVPVSPFGFFLSCLNEKEYVLSGQNPGVNVFKWRVAAASPFACHFVLNASQGAAAVLYQPMKFLRQDKRKALGLEDRDATGAFFVLCDTGGERDFKTVTRISASSQTFSGWAIPHSFFARGKTVNAPSCPEGPGSFDPYREERRFWRDVQKNGETAELRKLFPLQKKSYGVWKSVLAQKENNFSFFDSPVPEKSPVRELLRNAILDRDGFLAVSPTRDLNVYYNCPLSWLYARIFGAGEFSLEAALLDDTALGILYHRILEKLFARIKNEDTVFNSGRLDIYKRWALEITMAAVKEEPAFKGPLAIPLVSPQAAGMSKKIAGLLDLEADFFGGYGIAELELPVSFRTGDMLIKGVIDRVSVSPDGGPLIVDYKTRYLPEQTAKEDLEEIPLSEFQMPLYIKLYEELPGAEAGDKTAPVREACFYSINDRKIKAVMEDVGGEKSKAPNREEYGIFLEAAEKQIEEFGKNVKALDFIPREIRFTDCGRCIYKTACRSTYFLNADAVFRGKEGPRAGTESA